VRGINRWNSRFTRPSFPKQEFNSHFRRYRIFFLTNKALLVGNYLVYRINKPSPCLAPQTPQQGVLTNKTAEIQGFVEPNLLEAHFRGGVFLSLGRVCSKLYRMCHYRGQSGMESGAFLPISRCRRFQLRGVHRGTLETPLPKTNRILV
jgi:hypothetical protein